MTKALFIVLPVSNPVDPELATENDNVLPDKPGFRLDVTGPRDRVLYWGTSPVMQRIPGKFFEGKPKRRDVRPYAHLRLLLVQASSTPPRALWAVTSESVPMLKAIWNIAENNLFPHWTKQQLIADTSPIAMAIKNNVPPEEIQRLKRVLAGHSGDALDNVTDQEIEESTAVDE